jgi:hypothetical protein
MCMMFLMGYEKKEGLGEGDPDLLLRENGNYAPYANFGVATVLESNRKQLYLDQSPLAPSVPGCAGDRGTIAGIRVVDVLEEPGGLLHVLEEPKRFRPGQYVPVWRDQHRRLQIERTHAAAVACQAELAQRGIGIDHAEVAPCLSWIETTEPVYGLDFELFDGRDEKIEIQRIAADRMLVDVAGVVLETARSPIAASTAAIGSVQITAVAALDAGHEALEISLDHRRRD